MMLQRYGGANEPPQIVSHAQVAFKTRSSRPDLVAINPKRQDPPKAAVRT